MGAERGRDFRLLWAGQSVSELGSQISLVALPLTAVAVLGAGPFQTGLLNTLQFLPFLLLGLPAGVWVDRVARRPVLIAADLGRTLAMASIPVTWALGLLRLPYAVGLAIGVCTVLFDVAYQSYLPALVSRNRLVAGNARLALTQSSAEVAGPGLGGLLVSAVGAPIAIAADAASYAASVLSLLLIRRREPRPDATGSAGLWSELVEGVRYVLGNRLLRPIAACTGLYNLFAHMAMAVLFVYAVRDLGLSAARSASGSASAASADRWAPCSPPGWGGASAPGRRSCSAAWVWAPGWLLVALAPRGGEAIAWLIASGLIGSAGGVAYNITQVSLRQAITPQPLQGRMNATMRFLVWGTIPIGAFTGGVIGTVAGLRAALWAAAVGTALAALLPTLSGVRRLRHVDDLTPAAIEAVGRAV